MNFARRPRLFEASFRIVHSQAPLLMKRGKWSVLSQGRLNSPTGPPGLGVVVGNGRQGSLRVLKFHAHACRGPLIYDFASNS